jgi:RimJ/RimL family protein N-acetyltransferase
MKWSIGTPLHLITEHYSLVSISDRMVTDEVIQWFSDREVMQFMNDPMDQSCQSLQKTFSAYDNRNNFALMITLKNQFVPIGIFRIYLEPRNSLCYTSVVIGNKDYWGKGVVLEVRSTIMRFLFASLKLNKICGNVRARNFPALFNYTKQGFIKEGVRKQQVRNREGGFEDVVEFGMVRQDWLAAQEEQQAPNE